MIKYHMNVSLNINYVILWPLRFVTPTALRDRVHILVRIFFNLGTIITKLWLLEVVCFNYYQIVLSVRPTTLLGIFQ